MIDGWCKNGGQGMIGSRGKGRCKGRMAGADEVDHR